MRRGWAVCPGVETLHPKRNEGLLPAPFQGETHGTAVGRSSGEGQDASVLCGDAEDTPGRGGSGTAGYDGVGWGDGAGLSVCCPLFLRLCTLRRGLAVSPVHPELRPWAAWGSLCVGGEGQGGAHW